MKYYNTISIKSKQLFFVHLYHDLVEPSTNDVRSDNRDECEQQSNPKSLAQANLKPKHRKND